MMHLSISSELAKDLARAALKEGISASEYVRKALAEKLKLETGKEYRSLQWGGVRESSKSKTVRNRLRAAAMAEKLKAHTSKNLSRSAK